MVRSLGGMGTRFGDQVIVMAVFAVDGASASDAIGNSGLNFTGEGAIEDAAWFRGQAGAICGV